MDIVFGFLAFGIFLLIAFIFWSTYKNTQPPDLSQTVITGLWQKYRWLVIALLVVVILLVITYNFYNRVVDAENRAQQAIVLSQQQAKDNNVIQNSLSESKQNAAMMAEFIKNAQAGKLQLVTNFTVTATSPQAAAQQVADRINKNDPTLPPAALEKTDRTVVTSVQTTPEQKASIDQQNIKNGTNINDSYITQVYKNNNYRNWEWSAGVGVHDGDYYVPVGLQRNYSKDAALSGEIHTDGTSINGGEIKYIRMTNKLFGLF